MGGSVNLVSTGDVALAGPIDVSGGDGGGLVQIEGSSVTTSAKIDLTSGAGSGGAELDVTGHGPVTIGGPIAGPANGSDALGGGTGADVSIVASGTVTLAGQITLGGLGSGALGGRLDVLTDADVVQQGALQADAWDDGATGGDVTLAAGGGIVLGSMSVQGGGSGGNLSVRAGGDISVGGALVTDGNSGLGDGGTVQVVGCGVQVMAAGSISSRGAGGSNVLGASGQMIVGGALTADEGNVLRFRDSTLVPILSGSLTPTTSPVADAGLLPCGVLPPPPPPPPPTDPGQECGDPLTSGLPGVICRVTAIAQTLAEAPPSALGGKLRAKRLRAKVTHIRTLVEAAGRPRRRTKSLRAADRQLAGLLNLVGRALDRGKIDHDVAARVLGLGGGASSEVKELRKSPS
jgi:hypothetical protein